MKSDRKVGYICGPLTELPEHMQDQVKYFYQRLADVCECVIGERAFVPHEHYDPVAAPNFSPTEVDCAERRQVCQQTSVLIVVALAPSWGGGIEVEMANTSRVPVIVLHPDNKKVSRLLRGNPAVVEVLPYRNEGEALLLLYGRLESLFAEAESMVA